MSDIWQPQWKANTAYLAVAVVIPTAAVFAGYTWRCTTAGTSAGTEPVWPDPTLGTTTIADGTVVWSVGSGFRQAVQYGVISLMQTFAAANPTIVRAVRSTRPGSFATASLPVFYLGDMTESDTYGNGQWIRAFSGLTAYLVDNLGTIEDSNDRMNFAADAIGEYLTQNYHASGARSILQIQSINDTEETDAKGLTYPAIEFQLGGTFQTEGRT